MMDPSIRQFSSFKIDPNQYEILRMIGVGHFGSAYLAKEISTGNCCALKQIPCQMMNPIQQEYLNREIEIMAQISHPALLRLKGFSTPFDSFELNDNTATIIMDFMENGSLFNVLQLAKSNHTMPYWNQTTKNKMLIGISSGMKYLHNMKIIHRDLKPENILLDENFEPKITDFGLSKIIDNNHTKSQKNTPNIGTPLYMPPEIFSNQPYSFKVDVFAFGIISYEIITGLSLYPDITNPVELAIKICNGERLSIPDDVPSDFKNLISRCWAQDPRQRPTFDEIYSFLIHPNTFLPGANLSHLNSYKKKICDAELNAKSNQTIKWISIENQLLLQKSQMEDLKKSLQELAINSKKNNEILRKNLSTVKNERKLIEQELQNSIQKNTELIKSISQQHRRIQIELKQLNLQKDPISENKPIQMPSEHNDIFFQQDLKFKECQNNIRSNHSNRRVVPSSGYRPSSLQLRFPHPITQYNNNIHSNSFQSDSTYRKANNIKNGNNSVEYDEEEELFNDFGNLDNLDNFDHIHDNEDNLYNCFDRSSNNFFNETKTQNTKGNKKKKERHRQKSTDNKNLSPLCSPRKNKLHFPRKISKINSRIEVVTA